MNNFNWQSFQTFIPDKNSYAINISASGRITLNPALFEKTRCKEIGLAYSPDGKYLLLNVAPEPEAALPVNKNRQSKCTQFTDLLLQLNIRLPARYTAKWVEEKQAWLCTLDKESPELSYPQTPKSPRKRYIKKIFEES